MEKVYSKLKNTLKTEIEEFARKPGTLLPSENELLRMYRISRSSVRAALAELQKEGLIEKRPGVGAVVRDLSKSSLSMPPESRPVRKVGVDLHGARQVCGADIYMTLFSDALVRTNHEFELVMMGGPDALLPSAQDCDAFIIAHYEQWSNGKLEKLAGSAKPLVVANAVPREKEFSCVTVNNAREGYRAAEYLIQLGHRDIGFIGQRSNDTAERLKGFEGACRKAGITPPSRAIFTNTLTPDNGNDIRDYFARNRISALIIGSEALFETLVAPVCLELGIQIPEDLSVMTFDYAQRRVFSRFPRISHIRAPIMEMLSRTVQILSEKPYRRTLAVIDSEMVILNSCRNPNEKQFPFELNIQWEDSTQMNSEKAGKIPEPEPAMLPAIPLPPSLPRHFPEKRQFQGIPSVAVTGAGGIYAVWYTGGEHEGPGNFCVVARGDDDGQNWRDPLLVVEHPHPNVRAFDPNLWVAPDGALWLFWAQSYSIQRGNTGDGRIGVWAARCAEPDAEAPVFESPVRIANGVMMNKPLVLSNGEWAFPTACWNDLTEHGALPVWPEFRHQKLSNITISPDSGKTFFWRGGADVPERCYDEHHILELKDGRLWMLVRTNYGIGQSFSIDKGRTWTPGEKTSFRSPNSRFFIRRLRSGRILLINNDDDSGLDYHQHPWRPRRNLTACLSGDDGKTWSDGLPLDSRGVAYPDAFEDMKGWIHVVFDMDRLKGGPILYSRLTEDDILAGRLVSKGSVSSRIISSFPYQENGREPGAEK